MAKTQFEIPEKSELSLRKIEQFAYANGIKVVSKPAQLLLALDWMAQMIDKLDEEDLKQILF